MSAAPSELTMHASCIDLDGKGVLILGASASGKSSLALQLMALGAGLVADDQVVVALNDAGDLIARAPDSLSGMIEARGIGIIGVKPVAETCIILCVDLDQTELHRLPPSRTYEILGKQVDTVHGRDNPALDAGLVALLKGSRLK